MHRHRALGQKTTKATAWHRVRVVNAYLRGADLRGAAGAGYVSVEQAFEIVAGRPFGADDALVLDGQRRAAAPGGIDGWAIGEVRFYWSSGLCWSSGTSDPEAYSMYRHRPRPGFFLPRWMGATEESATFRHLVELLELRLRQLSEPSEPGHPQVRAVLDETVGRLSADTVRSALDGSILARDEVLTAVDAASGLPRGAVQLRVGVPPTELSHWRSERRLVLRAMAIEAGEVSS